ncbi:hypothetical protein ACQ4WX_50060 [Streptomyces lasalocidi]
MDRELGLADPGHAFDRGDHDCVGAVAVAAVRRHLDQPGELLAAAGEGGQIRGQLPEDPDRPAGLDLRMHPDAGLAPAIGRPFVQAECPNDAHHEIQIKTPPTDAEEIHHSAGPDGPSRSHERPDSLRQHPVGGHPRPCTQLTQQTYEVRQIRSCTRLWHAPALITHDAPHEAVP